MFVLIVPLYIDNRFCLLIFGKTVTTNSSFKIRKMNSVYRSVESLWTDIPNALQETKLVPEINILKMTFEKKKAYFEDNVVKIVVVGNVSNGKSTFINALLGRQLFSTTAGQGTPSFFVCSSTDKTYEYYTMDDDEECLDLTLLQRCTQINTFQDNYINENTLFKVYINPNENSFLTNNTCIIDCPGMNYSDSYDQAVRTFCKNADIFVLLFDVRQEATPREREYVNMLRSTFRNPFFVFIYNKCDELDKKVDLEKIRANFRGNFQEKNVENSLFFISAKCEMEKKKTRRLYEQEFEKLKDSLTGQKAAAYIRLQNVYNSSIKELEGLHEKTEEILKELEKEKATHDVELKSFINKCQEPLTSKRMSEEDIESVLKKMESDKEEIVQAIIKEAEVVKKKMDEVIITRVVHESIKSVTGQCNRDTEKEFVARLCISVDDGIQQALTNLIKDEWLKNIEIILENYSQADVIKGFTSQMTYKINFVDANIEISHGLFGGLMSRENTIDVKCQYYNYVKSRMIDIRRNMKSVFTEEITKNVQMLKELILNLYDSKKNLISLEARNSLENREKHENMLKEKINKCLHTIESLTEYQEKVSRIKIEIKNRKK